MSKSPAWKFFEKSSRSDAICLKCNKKILTKGGSTKGLLIYMKSAHNESFDQSQSVATNDPISILEDNEPCPKKTKITDYYNNGDTLSKVLARMAARDGLHCNIFITSEDIWKGLTARGFEVPKSHNTIIQKVLEYANEVESMIKSNLTARKANKEKMSVTLDEWTGVNNKRYCNINIHLNSSVVQNLGLIRINGSMTSEVCKDMVLKHLGEFGLDVEKDVICSVADGAAVMMKFGRLMPYEQYLCYAHGIHLAVADVLYSKRFKLPSTELQEEFGDSDEDVDCFEIAMANDAGSVNFTEDFNVLEVVKKVRKIIVVFKKSPMKSDCLRTIVRDDHGKELNLILDCKTR